MLFIQKKILYLHMKFKQIEIMTTLLEKKIMKILLFNRSSRSYATVYIGSNEHKELIQKGYEYRGLSHVALWTENLEADKANEDFLKTIK